MSLENQTVIHEFILLAFSNIYTGRFLIFLFLLLIYLVTLVGNLLIIFAFYFNVHLHSPMYFFLGNFYFSEIVFTANITPNMLVIIFHGGVIISTNNCITQYYIYWVSTFAECLLLTVMSYDRYLAICSPLHYSSIMSQRHCLHLVVWSWLTSFLLPVIEGIWLSELPFCGYNIIDHFVCDLAPVLQLSCSDTSFLEMTDFILSFPVFVFPIIFIIICYIRIISTILKIPSRTGRKKAFSTCSSHLIVVCTYYGTLVFIYMTPSTDNSFTVKNVLSLVYIVVTPLINQFIYSLRSKEIRLAIVKLFSRFWECEF
ncbi:olfactory receptor 1468-like [Pelobates fuscus]|uniref:olfactory receptor 1468-like n=1 Tax=Pelobates fuscus TaxID=191477 RepID=UPI002FE4BED4